jgi:anti-sigma factor RsiW
MACDLYSAGDKQPQLAAFVDGELSGDARRELEAHVAACPVCAAEMQSLVHLKNSVRRTATQHFVPSAEFRRRITAQVQPRRRAWRAGLIWAPSLAAVAIILVAVGWVVQRQSGGSLSATRSEIVDLHVAELASANPVDVVSTDEHTVKPWFEGKLPFAVNLPDLTKAQFTLLGGRVVYLHQSPGAALLFQYRKHRLSTYVFQESPKWNIGSVPGKVEQQDSFWVETWNAGGLRYFVVGDTSAENVDQLAGLMRSASAAK